MIRSLIRWPRDYPLRSTALPPGFAEPVRVLGARGQANARGRFVDAFPSVTGLRLRPAAANGGIREPNAAVAHYAPPDAPPGLIRFKTLAPKDQLHLRKVH